MRIAVVHNLPPGGARRRLASQVAHLDGELVEVCLESATPITEAPMIVPFKRRAPRMPRLLRPPLRYIDLISLERAWRHAALLIRDLEAGVVYLNPCRFLQAPPVLSDDSPPALYFCDEVRRVDAEEAAQSMRNPLTRPLYGALYARERTLDRRSTSRAAAIVTNSRYSAGEIERVYGRRPRVVTMGVADSMLADPNTGARENFLLSVGTLIAGKGHELVLRAASLAASRPAVSIVAPRPMPSEQRRLSELASDLDVQLDLRVGISDAELAALYRSARATLYLARREPLGLASLEAQASGCPVIVADEGGLPETIVGSRTGWTTTLEPPRAAELVDRLADEGLAQRMSAAASEHAKGWSWQASAAQIGELLSELAQRRNTAAGAVAHV